MSASEMKKIKGFHYTVSERQLRVFRSCSPARRLQWLEEMRELSWQLAPPEAKKWWSRLRLKPD